MTVDLSEIKTKEDLESSILVTSSQNLNGVLKIQGAGENFKKLSDEYLDHLGTFRDWSRIPSFKKEVESANYSLYWDISSNIWWENYLRFSTENFEVKSPFLDNHTLFPFQHIGMNFCYYVLTNDFNPRVLVEWGAGTGKTILSLLMAQRLFEEGRIDNVLIFCKRVKQPSWKKHFETETTLSVQQLEGERAKRHQVLRETDAQVLILNYEKARFPSKKRRSKDFDWSRTDLKELLEFVDNKRVLIICDEAQKFNNSFSQISQGLDALFNTRIEGYRPQWVGGLALTATPYTVSPLNIHDIYSVLVPNLSNVSEGKRQFQNEYMDHAHGFDIFGEVVRWDKEKLYVLGKRHERYSHIVSKMNPDIASQFPPQLELDPIEISLSDADAKKYNELYDYVLELNNNNWDFLSLKSVVNLLRSFCNTPVSLNFSSSDIVSKFKTEQDDTAASSKFQYIADLVQNCVNQNEKVVLFSYWTHGTLFPYANALKKVLGSSVLQKTIWGVGMKDSEFQSAVDEFNGVSGGAVLLSSDAGQDGIDLYAHNIIHIETPTTYSTFRQRSDRISRSDSRTHGIEHNTIYRFKTSSTIEEGVENKMQRRKQESSLTSRSNESFEDLRDLLLFSKRELRLDSGC